ncbi:MAG: DUF4007 family protein [Chloroflexi bacterium]|jgi:hypothetical protein|nr:MAG: DUF4007 family protein [Chloroflexota bacterium]
MSSSSQDWLNITFSGHETFTLRSNWLKKAFDLLQDIPDLFRRDDAFVLLGVGKNMAQSIRFWGRATRLFERTETGDMRATALGAALLADNGWDPFLVTAAGRWLLHYQIVSNRDSAFTWYYTFNLLKRGDFTVKSLRANIVDFISQKINNIPSENTLNRDIDCMVRCYVRAPARSHAHLLEEVLHCPLLDLNLIQALPDQSGYRLASGAQPDLPDALVALAAFEQARWHQRATLSFNDLAYGERSPGRIFRLDEDSLLSRLFLFEEVTGGIASYSDSGGIRQVIWRDLSQSQLECKLIESAFASENTYA